MNSEEELIVEEDPDLAMAIALSLSSVGESNEPPPEPSISPVAADIPDTPKDSQVETDKPNDSFDSEKPEVHVIPEVTSLHLVELDTATMSKMISGLVDRIFTEKDIFSLDDDEKISLIKPLLFILNKASHMVDSKPEMDRYCMFIALTLCAAALDSSTHTDHAAKTIFLTSIRYCVSVMKRKMPSKLNESVLQSFRGACELLRWLCTDHKIQISYKQLAAQKKPGVSPDLIFEDFFDDLNSYRLSLSDEKTIGFIDAISSIINLDEHEEQLHASMDMLEIYRKANKQCFVSELNGVETMLSQNVAIFDEVNTMHKLYQSSIEVLQDCLRFCVQLHVDMDDLNKDKYEEHLAKLCSTMLAQLTVMTKGSEVPTVKKNQNVEDVMQSIDTCITLTSDWKLSHGLLQCIVSSAYLGLSSEGLAKVPVINESGELMNTVSLRNIKMVDFAVKYLTEQLRSNKSPKGKTVWGKKHSIFGHSDVAEDYDLAVLDCLFGLILFGYDEVSRETKEAPTATSPKSDGKLERKESIVDSGGIFGSIFDVTEHEQEESKKEKPVTVKKITQLSELMPIVGKCFLLLEHMFKCGCTRVESKHLHSIISIVKRTFIVSEFTDVDIISKYDDMITTFVQCRNYSYLEIELVNEIIGAEELWFSNGQMTKFLARILLNRLKREKDNLAPVVMDSYINGISKNAKLNNDSALVLVAFLFHSLSENERIEFIRKCVNSLCTNMTGENTYAMSVGRLVELVTYMVTNFSQVSTNIADLLRDLINGVFVSSEEASGDVSMSYRSCVSICFVQMYTYPRPRTSLSVLERVFDVSGYNSKFNELMKITAFNSISRITDLSPYYQFLSAWIMMAQLPISSIREPICNPSWWTPSYVRDHVNTVLHNFLLLLEKQEDFDQVLSMIVDLANNIKLLDPMKNPVLRTLTSSLLSLIEIFMSTLCPRELDVNNCNWNFKCEIHESISIPAPLEEEEEEKPTSILALDLEKELEKRKNRTKRAESLSHSSLVRMREEVKKASSSKSSTPTPLIEAPVSKKISKFEKRFVIVPRLAKDLEVAVPKAPKNLIHILTAMLKHHTSVYDRQISDFLSSDVPGAIVPFELGSVCAMSALAVGFSVGSVDRLLEEFGWPVEKRAILSWVKNPPKRLFTEFVSLEDAYFHIACESVPLSIDRMALISQSRLIFNIIFAIIAHVEATKPEIDSELANVIGALVVDSKYSYMYPQLLCSLKAVAPEYFEAARIHRLFAGVQMVETINNEYKKVPDSQRGMYLDKVTPFVNGIISLYQNASDTNSVVYVSLLKLLTMDTSITKAYTLLHRFDLGSLIIMSTYIPSTTTNILQLFRSLLGNKTELRPILERMLVSLPTTVLAEWLMSCLTGGHTDDLVQFVSELLHLQPVPPSKSEGSEGEPSNLITIMLTGVPSTLNDSTLAAIKATLKAMSSIMKDVLLHTSLPSNTKSAFFCHILQMASLRSKTLRSLAIDAIVFLKDVYQNHDLTGQNNSAMQAVTILVAFLMDIVSISSSKPMEKLHAKSEVTSTGGRFGETTPDSSSLGRPPTRRGSRNRGDVSEGLARTRSAAHVLLGSLGEIARSGVPIDELVAELADADPSILRTVARLVPRPSSIDNEEEEEEESSGTISLSRLLADSWRERDSAVNHRGLYDDDYVSLFQDDDDSSPGHTRFRVTDKEPAFAKNAKLDTTRSKTYLEASEGDKDPENFDSELCTYTATGNEFMEQHWYYCYSCSLSPNEGVCATCARVCHRGHDITYGRFSRFYCDCGAGVTMSKAGVPCKCLHKRASLSGKAGFSTSTLPTPYFRAPRKLPLLEPVGSVSSSKTKNLELSVAWRNHVFDDLGLDSNSNSLSAKGKQLFSDIAKTVFQLYRKVSDGLYNLTDNVDSSTTITSKALLKFDSISKCELVKSPQVAEFKRATKSGVFNVKLKTGSSLAKEARSLVQSNAITRQLLGADAANRVISAEAFQDGGGSSRLRVCDISALVLGSDETTCNFCCSTSHKSRDCPHASSEGLSEYVQQVYEYGVGFDVLGIAMNPENSRFVAVRGIRDVAVVVVPAATDNSITVKILPLEIQLDAIGKNCHVVSLQWLPGSQTRVAVVSTHVIKIYDLGKDSIAPVHYIEMIEDTIKDACFVPHSTEKTKTESFETAIVLSAKGNLFSQELFVAEDGGACILTNTVDMPEVVKPPSAGVSVYYHQSMDYVFVCYEDGRCFALRLAPNRCHVTSFIDLSQFEDTSKYASRSRLGPFINWTAVPFVQHGHALVTAVSRRSGIPVIFDFTEDTVYLQRLTKGKSGDISGQSSDGISVLLSFSGKPDNTFKLPHEEGTAPTTIAYPSIVVLCEDGSLTHYEISACQSFSNLKLSSSANNEELMLRKHLSELIEKGNRRLVSPPMVALEFFEHLESLQKSAELGGDVLKQMSVEETRKLFVATGDNYVISQDSESFTILVRNNDERMCICGLRVLFGTPGNEHIPNTLKIFGRTIRTKKVKRWYDIPFSVDEILSVDKSVKFVLGKTNTSGCNPALDAIEVYGLNKTHFRFNERVKEYSELIFGAKTRQNVQPNSAVDLCLGRCMDIVYDLHTHPREYKLPGELISEIQQHVPPILSANDSEFVQGCAKQVLRLVSGSDYYKLKDLNRLEFVFHRLHMSEGSAELPMSYLIWNASSIALKRPSNFSDFLSLKKEYVSLSEMLSARLRDPLYKSRLTLYDVAGAVDIIICTALHLLKTEDLIDVASVLKSQLLPFLSENGTVVQLITARACGRFLLGLLSLLKMEKKKKATSTESSTALGCHVCHTSPITAEVIWHCTECSAHVCNECHGNGKAGNGHETTHTMTEYEEALDEEAMLQAAISVSLEGTGSEVKKERSFEEAASLLPSLVLKEIASACRDLATEGGMAILGHVLLIHGLYGNVPDISLLFAESVEEPRPAISLEVLDHLWPSDQILEPKNTISRSSAGESELLRLLLFSYLLRDVRSRERFLRKGGKPSESGRTPTPDWISGLSVRSTTDSGLTSAATLAVVRGVALRTALRESGLVTYLLDVLKRVLVEFKNMSIDSGSTHVSATSTGTLSLLTHRTGDLPPALEPFFSASYIASHNDDLFADYGRLFADACLRLADSLVIRSVEPAKSANNGEVLPSTDIQPHDKMFSTEWFEVLTGLINTPQCSFLAKNAKRVLLSLVDGSRTAYYLVKDKYFFITEMAELESAYYDAEKCGVKASSFEECLGYDRNVRIVERLAGLVSIVTERPFNWQLILRRIGNGQSGRMGWMSLLQRAIFRLSKETVTYALVLLGTAVAQAPSKTKENGLEKDEKDSASSEKEKKELDVMKAAGIVSQLLADFGLPEDFSAVFGPEATLLAQFVQNFLLDCNVSAVRRNARSYVHGIWTLLAKNPADRLSLLKVLSKCIAIMPSFGKNAAEFGDLLACVLDNSDLDRNIEEQKVLLGDIIQHLLSALRSQNALLVGHSNASIYRVLDNVLELGGYFLESTPCLVCNDPETPFMSQPLDSMGAEVKYTETCIVVRLPHLCSIKGIVGMIGVSNAAKQVRTVNVYYNNSDVKSISELKNQWHLWKLVKSVHIEKNASEIPVELPIPISLRNLMIEYSAFHDDFQAMSTEKILCPRCSRLVTDRHAVCSNCHENAYQCRQCRNINYEQPDAFLCNECGYCRFANFSYILYTRPSLETRRIVGEDDRKKALEIIRENSESADDYYNAIASIRNSIGTLTDSLMGALPSSAESPGKEAKKSGENGSDELTRIVDTTGKKSSGSTLVNKRISTVADVYGNYCRENFESLSSTSRKLIATRRELLHYLQAQRTKAAGLVLDGDTETFEAADTRCFGCANNFISLCMSPLSALGRNPATAAELVEAGAVQELLDCNLYQGPAKARIDARHTLCLLSRENVAASELIGNHIEKKLHFFLDNFRNVNIAVSVRDEMMLLTEMCSLEDSLWNLRFRLVMNILFAAIDKPSALNSPEIANELVLPLIRIISKRSSLPDKYSSYIEEEVKEGEAPKEKQGTESEPEDGVKKVLEEHTGAFRLTAIPSMVTNLLRDHDKHVAVYQRWIARNLPSVRDEPQEFADLKPSLRHLVGWCATHWMHVAGVRGTGPIEKEGDEELAEWLPKLILCSSSAALRREAVMLVIRLSVHMGSTPRAFHFLDMATNLLNSVHSIEEESQDLFYLLRTLTHAVPSGKIYLVSKGLLSQLTDLISKEVATLLTFETSLSTDVSRGYVLKELCTMLSECVEYPTVLTKFINDDHVMTTLDAYVALRGVVIQKTKLTSDAMDLLLKVLQKAQTTEEEKRNFVSACVSTLKKHMWGNEATFIIEQIVDIICPIKTAAAVKVCLNKAPTQEEFIRGRMNKNPYSSDAVGPLMRDVKNIICTDLDLIGLIEDDSGMELLVAERIIKLDLPVVDVYEYVWKLFLRHQQPAHDFEQRGGYPPMNITYRLSGLDGEATEDIVESVGEEEEEIDPEEQYSMSSVLTESGGFDTLVTILARIRDFDAERPLSVPLLRLLYYCSKVKVSRRYLLHLNAITTLLMALRQTLPIQSLFDLAEWLLLTIEAIVSEANISLDRTDSISEDVSKVLFHSRTGQSNAEALARETSEDISVKRHMDDMKLLLSELENPSVRSNTRLVTGISRIIPALTFGDRRTMNVLVKHFSDDCKWDLDNSKPIADDVQYRLQCLCRIIENIKADSHGSRLKSLFIDVATKNSIEYMVFYLLHPEDKGKRVESSDCQEALVNRLKSLHSLPHILSLLAALAYEHSPTQTLIQDAGLFPVLHELEQIAGDDDPQQLHALAENVLDSCATKNSDTRTVVEELRAATKAEKRNKAQAMREKMLQDMGFKVSGGARITLNQTARARLHSVDDIKEEEGVKCLVCQEGYGFRPKEALAAYVFDKRVYLADTGTPVDQMQPQQLLGRQLRSDMGYTTVTHFNIIHLECHSRAVRADRRKKQPLEEWEGATLRNSQTLCNNMIPLRGKNVSQSTYSHAVGRFWSQQSNIYHLESPRFRLVAHDLRLLLTRFARQESFSTDSHGGGGESNILLIPMLLQMGHYHLDEESTGAISSCRKQYERVLTGYLSNPTAVAIPPNAVDNVPYMLILSLFLHSPKEWKSNRVAFLEQIMQYGCHIHRLQRRVKKTETGSSSAEIPGVDMADYTVDLRFKSYRSMLVYFALVNELQSVLKPESGNGSHWVTAMNNILRDDFQKLQPLLEGVLSSYDDEFVVLESVDEFLDVCGVLGDVLNGGQSVAEWEEGVWAQVLARQVASP